MSKCKYCGQSAGFFSRTHKECEEKHLRGIEGMTQLMRRYFNGSVTSDNLGAKISRNKKPYFLTDEDIVMSAEATITDYSETLHRPFSSDILPKIKGFISNVGVPYEILNKNGILDRLSQKLFQGYVVDFFAKGVPLSQIATYTNSILSVLPLSQQKQNEAYYNVLNKAAEKFLTNGLLTDKEQQLIESYTSSLGITLNSMPSQYLSENLVRLSQAIILNNLQRGIQPQCPLTVPVILSRGEIPFWIYDNVTMLQEKITREYIGGSQGLSFRICKGLIYRTGSFKGHPIERSHLETIGIGQLVVTNKQLIFHCKTTSVRIPYSKLTGVAPYSDGLEVHKEEAKPKRTVFQGFDAWFIMNILNLVNI